MANQARYWKKAANLINKISGKIIKKMSMRKLFKQMSLFWLVAGLLVLSLTAFFSHISTDENVFWQVAKIWNLGKLPYRDIFDNKPPGIYLIYLSGLKLGLNTEQGVTLLARLLTMMFNWVSAWLVYLIGVWLGNKKIATWSAIGYLLFLPYYQGQFALTEPFMATGLLLATYLLFKNPDRKITYFIAGVIMGIAFQFKQVALINVGVVLLYILYKEKRHWRTLINKSILILAGFLLIEMLVIGYFEKFGALADYWNSVYVFNYLNYPPMWLRTRQRLWIFIWPILAWHAWQLALVKKGVIKNEQGNNRNKFKLLLWLSVLLPLPVVLSRPYHHYWLQILPFVFLLQPAYLWNGLRARK